MHPQTGAVIIRPGAREFEGGKVTRRFEEVASALAIWIRQRIRAREG